MVADMTEGSSRRRGLPPPSSSDDRLEIVDGQWLAEGTLYVPADQPASDPAWSGSTRIISVKGLEIRRIPRKVYVPEDGGGEIAIECAWIGSRPFAVSVQRIAALSGGNEFGGVSISFFWSEQWKGGQQAKEAIPVTLPKVAVSPGRFGWVCLADLAAATKMPGATIVREFLSLKELTPDRQPTFVHSRSADVLSGTDAGSLVAFPQVAGMNVHGDASKKVERPEAEVWVARDSAMDFLRLFLLGARSRSDLYTAC